ncbi:DUF2207 domain-containing protein [Mogibacterium pumilum]|uniref:DUF2207 domain-containing protein n=1 Tax=Mogibacterium pumilum TaxID=86332 RepID=A0A223AT11_9FIRM|nr:DUF2207 domain-containing protein [Mogibacterium pumilum]ASS38100.1 hypothetical protein AXF17_06555 [Mogibacterium pumilum]
MYHNAFKNRLNKLALILVVIFAITMGIVNQSNVYGSSSHDSYSNSYSSSYSNHYDQNQGSPLATQDYDRLGYTTKVFDVDVKVNKDYSYDFTETITVDFKYPKHGIYRKIPIASNYKVKDISVEGGDVKVTKDKYINIRIGSHDSYVTGEKTYVIKYKIYNYIHSDKDNNIYVDVLPTEWETSIASSKIKVSLPSDFKYTEMKSYSGSYGTPTKDNSKWSYDKSSNTLSYEDAAINYNSGVTLMVKTPANYWVGAPSKAWSNVANAVVLILCLVGVISLKLTRKKDADIVAPIMFNPPDGITSAELGYLADGVVDKKDIASLYLYLASKGYIQIIEGSKRDITIKALAAPEGEPAFIKKTYNSIFGGKSAAVGSTVSIKESGKSIGESYDTIKSQLTDRYTGDKAIISKTSDAKGILATFIAAIGYIASIVLSVYRGGTVDVAYHSAFSGGGIPAIFGIIVILIVWALIWLFILHKLSDAYFYRKTLSAGRLTSKIVAWVLIYYVYMSTFINALYFMGRGEGASYVTLLLTVYTIAIPFLLSNMQSRTEYNRKIYGEILGFKEFIETAELDRINELVESDPSYFYNVLPYAYVLGLTDKWIHKFNTIKIPEHTGFSSYNTTTFNYMSMSTMMNSIQHSTYSGIAAAHADSGGGIGGFSGGGFSGGGSGGGGGGAW